MLFEIINMSDSYTLKSDDVEAACMAVTYLGEGAYGLEEIDGDFKMPIFLFGGYEEFFKITFNHSFEESNKLYTGEKVDVMIDALKSIVIGSRSDRDIFESATSKITDEAERKKFIDEWNDKKRSSMNDIGGYAQKLVKRFEKKEVKSDK